MAESLAPTDADGLADAVRWAVAGEAPLEVIAGGSKQTLGRPVQSAATLSLAAFEGIVDYQPSELVLTAQAATPLATIEAALEAERQMLAFEPADYGPLLRASGGADLAVPTSARLAVPTSARLAVPTSARLAVPTSARLAVPTSARLAVPTSARLAVPTSARLAVPTSARLAVPTSARLAVPTSARLAARLWAAHWPATSPAHAGSRRGPRAITSSACMR